MRLLLGSAHSCSGVSALDAVRMLLVIGSICCCALSLVAQTADSRTVGRRNQSWTATTDSRSDNLLPSRLPVHITESHSQNSQGTLDKRSVEIRGTDWGFEPYQDIETETRQVDASTVRTVTRTFGRDINGKKALVQVTEEEKRILAGHDSNIVRVTYNPDANGKLQPVQRDIVETRETARNREETNTTVMLTNINGGLAGVCKTREVRKAGENNAAETEKTTWSRDVNGGWQLSEIRHNVATSEAEGRRIDETVFRPDADGKVIQISHVVSHEFADTSGEKRSSEETYSIEVPGTPQDGRLHLVERKTSVERSKSPSERMTQQEVEQINPGDPDAGPRLSVLVDDRMVQASSGEQASITIRARDYNGRLDTVSVDMTESDRVPTIQIQQTPSEQPR